MSNKQHETCWVCREAVTHDGIRWTHQHTKDEYCWTGDGSTAVPQPESDRA